MSILLTCGCQSNSIGTRAGTTIAVPSCAIHDCFDPAPFVPDLTNRIAHCAYHNSCGQEEPSINRNQLAFFEFKGEGSPAAIERCKCGYHEKAHNIDKPHLKGKTDHPFEPHGPYDFDLYYCGCRGWD